MKRILVVLAMVMVMGSSVASVTFAIDPVNMTDSELQELRTQTLTRIKAEFQSDNLSFTQSGSRTASLESANRRIDITNGQLFRMADDHTEHFLVKIKDDDSTRTIPSAFSFHLDEKDVTQQMVLCVPVNGSLVPTPWVTGSKVSKTDVMTAVNMFLENEDCLVCTEEFDSAEDGNGNSLWKAVKPTGVQPFLWIIKR